METGAGQVDCDVKTWSAGQGLQVKARTDVVALGSAQCVRLLEASVRLSLQLVEQSRERMECRLCVEFQFDAA